MKKFTRYLPLLAAVLVLIIVFKSCNDKNKVDLPSMNYPDADLVQLREPEEGQEIAIIETTMGTMKVALYREYAPETVEYFVNLAKSGYYDGKYVYCVYDGQYFMAGTAKSDGYIVFEDEVLEDGEEATEGKYDASIREAELKELDEEVSENLWPFKYSFVSVGRNKTNKGIEGGGTFFCGVGSLDLTDESVKEAFDDAEDANPAIVEEYMTNGGQPMLHGSYTVFAQTYEGKDVFDKILTAPADNDMHVPEDPIQIISIKIATYEK